MPDLVGVVGGKSAKALGTLGITTVEDLLAHYPRRYAERGELTDLASLQVGEQVTVLARVASATSRPLPSKPGQRRRRSITEAVVTDGTGELTLTFFNQDWIEKKFRVGRLGLFAGTVGVFNGRRQLLHPEHEFVDEEAADEAAADYAGRLIAVYPATEKVNSWTIARIVRMALPEAATWPDPLDEDLRARVGVIDLPTALQWVHRPVDRGQARRAIERLRWDEAFGVQVVLAQRRAAITAAPAIPRPGRTRWPARRVRRGPAVHADRRAARGRRGHRCGDRRQPPHAPPPAGGGRLGQDRGRAAGDAAGRRLRRAGGPARAHRGAGRAARPQHRRAARAAGPGRDARWAGRRHADRPADRIPGGDGAPGGAARCGQRGGGHRRRHPRPARGAGAVRRPRAGRGRRAAPVRRRAARRAGGQDGGVDSPAHAGDDGHADPADRGHDRVR